MQQNLGNTDHWAYSNETKQPKWIGLFKAAGMKQNTTPVMLKLVVKAWIFCFFFLHDLSFLGKKKRKTIWKIIQI